MSRDDYLFANKSVFQYLTRKQRILIRQLRSILANYHQTVLINGQQARKYNKNGLAPQLQRT